MWEAGPRDHGNGPTWIIIRLSQGKAGADSLRDVGFPLTIFAHMEGGDFPLPQERKLEAHDG